eukprot:m.456070 g.456070  ORF g.456070 m.456070 type:complete len:69 (-) comp20982_c0_seq1:26-232(-)
MARWSGEQPTIAPRPSLKTGSAVENNNNTHEGARQGCGCYPCDLAPIGLQECETQPATWRVPIPIWPE